MHPLRFHNSGIRAKVFVRKNDFKLRVIVLHFLAAFSQRRQRGGAASHGQLPCRAGHPRLGCGQGQPARGGAYKHGGLQPARKGAGYRATHLSGGRERLACKGLLPVARPQGAAARDEPARGRPLATNPQGAAACAGAAATAAQRAARRGLRHPFEKKMILPL
ncbi:hypothetical protein GW17_00032869 [Ensete ventricosum]|nr:hypothetical protein GW17_00032869 [Ensete ventricosum]RZS15429.1 hypothetical protein BHM03_00047266 [Ensete ventricosum]